MTAYVYVIYWCTDIVVGIAATVDAAKQYCVKHNEGPITNPEWNYEYETWYGGLYRIEQMEVMQ
jgi:hypothetical protein